ncbi:AAA family ATPase [Oryzifoliimicrobium ureilyticus]|uniref:AAA family ATPase n=1 Tax=Oryzifoliimicrobium ureilyticus TaxID=3113724 RepID=UPI0030762E2D
MHDQHDLELPRILIIGNGGSGKTWLSRKLARHTGLPVIHLDDLRWEPGNYGIARSNDVVVSKVEEAGKAEAWIIEGVYGWLASRVLERATTLIWIDLPEAECIANIRQRGIQGGGSQESFEELVTWVSEYRIRDNSSSHIGHLRLFEAFKGNKLQIKQRAGMTALLEKAENQTQLR